MSSIRWRKVLRDLWSNDIRTILAIFAITIGIFGVGSILSAYAILTREIDVNFRDTTPPSAILSVEGADEALAKAVENLPGVAVAEPRRTIQARVSIGPNEWRPMVLFVIDDFNALRVATFTSEKGSWPPADRELLIERESFLDYNMGDMIVVRTPNGQDRELLISGVVHDPAQAPGWQDRLAYGYITLNTLAWFGESPTFNELRIVVADNAFDVSHIREVAYQVKDFVEQRGYSVSLVYIPKPGEHPHTDQMDSMLFLFEAFGILALILSAILVSNIITALLAQQIRQIGVMKAVGARTYQIVWLYFGTVSIYGIVALAVGIPLGQWAGRGYAAFTAVMLNFDITNNSIPLWVYIVQIAVGISVPLLAASVPVLKGSRITVRQALSDYGTGQGAYRTNLIDTLASTQKLSRPLLLSLRNTFRRKLRLVLTVGILAAGGAAFMSAFNVGASWTKTIDESLSFRHYDLEVRFVQPYPAARVEEILRPIPGVVSIESWEQLLAVQERADGTDGIRFYITGLPPATDMVNFPVVEGRWLQPGDTNAVVVNQDLLSDPEADIRVGDQVLLRLGGGTSEWNVVGVVREVGAPRRGLGSAASAYVPLDSLARVTNTQGMTTNVRIQTAKRNNTYVTEVNRKIEQQLDDAGLLRLTIQLTTERANVLKAHLVVIEAFLMGMAILVAAVGGLALASAISISVMERIREVGIMRAIGASTNAVLRIIIVEAVVIGILSWLVAALLTIPLSVMVGDTAGQIFLNTDLSRVFSPLAMIAWFGLIILISIIASFYPAWKAARLTVHEVLAYE